MMPLYIACLHDQCELEANLNQSSCDYKVHLEQGTVLSLIEKDGVVKGVKYKSIAGEELETFTFVMHDRAAINHMYTYLLREGKH